MLAEAVLPCKEYCQDLYSAVVGMKDVSAQASSVGLSHWQNLGRQNASVGTVGARDARLVTFQDAFRQRPRRNLPWKSCRDCDELGSGVVFVR